jgi:hypothetical protein
MRSSIKHSRGLSSDRMREKAMTSGSQSNAAEATRAPHAVVSVSSLASSREALSNIGESLEGNLSGLFRLLLNLLACLVRNCCKRLESINSQPLARICQPVAYQSQGLSEGRNGIEECLCICPGNILRNFNRHLSLALVFRNRTDLCDGTKLNLQGSLVSSLSSASECILLVPITAGCCRASSRGSRRACCAASAARGQSACACRAA